MTSVGDGDFTRLNAEGDASSAYRLAKALEEAEARRTHVSISAARKRVAARLGCSAGTLENIRRLRAKSIPHWLLAKIRAAYVAELQKEINRLEHEITVTHRTNSRACRDDLDTAQAALETARAIILRSKND